MLFSHLRSIVTATRLNFCVRNGNRCFPRAMGTEAASLMRHPFRVSHRAGRRSKSVVLAALPELGKAMLIDVHLWRLMLELLMCPIVLSWASKPGLCHRFQSTKGRLVWETQAEFRCPCASIGFESFRLTFELNFAL